MKNCQWLYASTLAMSLFLVSCATELAETESSPDASAASTEAVTSGSSDGMEFSDKNTSSKSSVDGFSDVAQDSKNTDQGTSTFNETKDASSKNEFESLTSPSTTNEPTQSSHVPVDPNLAPHSTEALAEITNIRFKGNDRGGTIVVDANHTMKFQSRINSDNRQFIVEIPNSKLPSRLRRPLVTKDFPSNIGSIDAYTSETGFTTNIVVQLKSLDVIPSVQSEGSSLLIISEGSGSDSVADTKSVDSNKESSSSTSAREQLLSSSNLDEFLTQNQKFYGKKISLEVTEMDLREVFKILMEESGVNMVLSDDVKGTISLKLREVPWDQALVVIMRTKKLGYTRQGSVIRVAALSDLRAEEDDASKVALQRKNNAPLKVKLIPISYAKIDELAKNVQTVLSEKGKVIMDSRTSSLVLTDLEEYLQRAEKLIQSIDTPPMQVLIEGKVIEARETFTRNIGLSWSASGSKIDMGTGPKGPQSAQPSLRVSPGTSTATMGLNLTMGTLDVLGDLSAALTLNENEGLVKVISAPRVVAIHNEPSNILQNSQVPFLSTTTDQNGRETRSANFKEVKLSLDVVPQITNDGSVIMKVKVNRDFLGSVVDSQTQARPVNSRSVSTQVLVRNGQTAVIGGIYQSDVSEDETRVPGLGSIPVLGWLFKNKNHEKIKSELLVFLTPRILGTLDSNPALHSKAESTDGGGAL